MLTDKTITNLVNSHVRMTTTALKTIIKYLEIGDFSSAEAYAKEALKIIVKLYPKDAKKAIKHLKSI